VRFLRIIIVGDGKVGYSLAENLAKDNHEVTIIDKTLEKLNKTVETLDVRCICGNGVSTSILADAGVKEADLLIAVTSSDEMNMICCLTAKKLGAAHVVARIRDTQYANEWTQLTEVLGLDMVINPESAVAREIARMIQFPPAVNIESFARGRVDMVEIKISAGMEICGMPLKNISKKYAHSILIGAVLRGTKAVIPNGDFILRDGDLIYVVGQLSRVYDFCKKIGIYIPKIKNAILIGGSRIAAYLGRYLNEMGIGVKIIELSHERCEELDSELPSVLVINGDGTDESLLRSEHISEAQAFIAITGHDEDNLMAALMAKEMGVPKVVAKISRLNYSNIITKLGIDNIVNPKLITANSIARFVRGLRNAIGNPVHTLYRIVEGQAEVVEFKASETTKIANIPLKRLTLKQGVLIAAITRANEIIVPHGNDKIMPGDRVIIITTDRILSDLDEALEAPRS
jgi:trk system potassium uptake protein TrkA